MSDSPCKICKAQLPVVHAGATALPLAVANVRVICLSLGFDKQL